MFSKRTPTFSRSGFLEDLERVNHGLGSRIFHLKIGSGFFIGSGAGLSKDLWNWFY
jgi:hypothetical protein